MAGAGSGERQLWRTADGGGGEEAPPHRPSINLPPRGSMDSVFNGGLSPGPMTLVSSFFTDGGGDDYKSFSQLLAGAMASPVAAVAGGSTGLVDSPSFFPPSQAASGISHQQALAQVTAQASQSPHSAMNNIQPQYSFSVSAIHVPAAKSNADNQHHLMPESNDYSQSDKQRLDPSSMNVDKPADDGYNWRKYGQKQVKGSEFPRSYYKCTRANCPVKKKVERSLEGHITAIIYKGEHNHQRPNQNKRSKDAMNSSEGSNLRGNYVDSVHLGTNAHAESSQATAEQITGTSDSEEVGDHETEVDDKNVEPDPKRRNTEVTHSDQASSHRTVTEPRIIVQTTSEVDLLDDGYRWRKYGQKVVKGNPYPRSYYKCTTQGCNVRKHVERASTDPKAVITTYEGKHNHDVPAAKTNSHTIANNTASQLRSQNATPEIHGFDGNRGISGNDQHQQPVARLRLKEEQIA